MDDIVEFINAHGFQAVEGGFAGTYADMHMAVYQEPDTLRVHLYLDLPRPGKRARAELIKYLAETAARYEAQVVEGADWRVLRFAFADPQTAIPRVERFLTQCDTALRPYGREMGVLCAHCRRELKEEDARELREISGEIMPVCEDCLAEPGNTKRAGENRRQIAAKRARMGMLGACAGMLVATGALVGLNIAGMASYSIIAIGVPFVIDYFYRRFGGLYDKWRKYILLSFSIISVIMGAAVSWAILVLRLYGEGVQGEGDEFFTIFAAYFTNFSVFINAVLPPLVFACLGVYLCVRGFRRRM